MRTALNVGLGAWLGSCNYCTSFSRSRLCPISRFLSYLLYVPSSRVRTHIPFVQIAVYCLPLFQLLAPLYIKALFPS